jgi:hypothetical protein
MTTGAERRPPSIPTLGLPALPREAEGFALAHDLMRTVALRQAAAAA